MPNYNYHVLSPTEFENLSRDLIQRKENIILETFKEGKDSGIDLRFAESSDKALIVQAKRYKDDYDVLYKKLKDNELPKVKKLNPARYIVVTSVGLTPLNKSALVTLFGGYIKSTSDIIGKDDLDNLIGLYPDLEKAHFKLWLTSTSIMQELLNSKEYNQSRFELETIVNEIRFYVQNESFDKAREIIKKERFVVISGIPGIGKTTLARMLAYRYLAEGYEDFIYISGNIDDALTLYSPSKRQIFLYDDFLGENFLSEKLSKNEDKRIISFVEKIKREDNKILIMTTREYILRQAETTYPLMEQLKKAKATLELSEYTSLIKAQILFNHLFFNGLSPEYVDNIVEDDNYLKIISHKNYNPRIIAAIAKNGFWEDLASGDYTAGILSYLDNPFKVWENVYETKISQLSQVILKVLAISGAPILTDDLRYALEQHMSFTLPQFKASLRELENTFIAINADSAGLMAVEFQNNSIQDYLLYYLKENRTELINLLQNIRFISHGFDMFIFPKKEGEFSGRPMTEYEPIEHDEETSTVLKQVISDNLDELLPSSRAIRRHEKGDGFVWRKYETNKLEWIIKTMNLFDITVDSNYKTKVLAILSTIDPYNIAVDRDFTSILYLRYNLSDYIETDIPKFIREAAKKIEDFDALQRFCEIADAYKSDFIEFRDSEEAKSLRTIALEWCKEQFAQGMAPTYGKRATDFMTRIFYKAEMERICDEINYVSIRMDLGVYLDSDYYKEFVRSKLQENSIDTNSKINNTFEKVNDIIKELFKSLKH